MNKLWKMIIWIEDVQEIVINQDMLISFLIHYFNMINNSER